MRLRTLLLPASEGAPSLLVLPGRADFLEKWAETLTDLHALGVSVASLDWRGQGLSTREVDNGAGHIDSFDVHLSDLDRAAAAFAAQRPGPWAVLAHSMGAHLLLRWLGAPGASAHPLRARLRAVVLTAPFFGLALPRPLGALALAAARLKVRCGHGRRYAWGQGPLAPHAAAAPARAALLTHDTARLSAEAALLAQDPRLLCGGVTWGWLSAFADSAQSVRRAALERLFLPVLALLAGADRLVSNRAARRVLARLPAARIETVAGARHELLRERDPIRAACLRRIRAHLAGHLI